MLLITFLSQARIFLAMARDGLLPHDVFGAVHPRFRTPHISTILTGVIICLVAALFPTEVLEDMVNIGTLIAFVFVCAAVLCCASSAPTPTDRSVPRSLRRRPAGHRRQPVHDAVPALADLARLVGWLVLGLVIYFIYGSGTASRPAT